MIPQAFINDLLARVDIVEIIGSRIELKKSGREYRGLSPFTNEKTPSFFVNPEKQSFFDFSSGKTGSAITFLMEYERLTFPEAVEQLAHDAGLTVPTSDDPAQRQANELAGKLFDAGERAKRFFRAQLRSSKEAIAYLKDRGVSGEIAKDYCLGFAPPSWDGLTKEFPQPDVAVQAGLLCERDGKRGHFDRFRNRVMFPIHDSRGRVLAFGGRTLEDDPAKYLNSPETPVFHKGSVPYGLYEAKKHAKTLDLLYVVEGYFDVVALAQAGVRNVVGCMGTALTSAFLREVFKHTRHIVLCFDGDRAGRAASVKALLTVAPFLDAERRVEILSLPDELDPDELMREGDVEVWRAFAKRAVPAIDAIIRELANDGRMRSIDGRAEMLERAKEYVSAMPIAPPRAALVHQLAQLTKLPAEQILLGQAAAPPAPADGAPAPIPMVLHCPKCGLQHIDKPEVETGWKNEPHRSHLCANPTCRAIWRPADVCTVGVESVTRGASDTWPPLQEEVAPEVDPAAASEEVERVSAPVPPSRVSVLSK